MRVLFAALIALGACQAPEVRDIDNASIADMGEDWSNLNSDLEGVDIMLTGGGGAYVPVPKLEVSTPTPGETMRLRVSGLNSGQTVALFAGRRNTGGGCGTYVPRSLQGFFGNCLAIIGAVPVSDLVVADWNGEVMVEVPVPASVALGRTIAFEAVSPAGPLTTRSPQVLSTTVGTKVDCVTDATGVVAMQGAEGVVVGEVSCTAIGGSFFAEEMLVRSRYYGGQIYESLSIFVGEERIGIESPNDAETNFEIDYEIQEGATVVFRLEADLASTGSDYYDSDTLVFDFFDGRDAAGNYVRWIGGVDDTAYVTAAPHEYFWPHVSYDSPESQYVHPGREYEIAIWGLCGDLGETDLEDWVFELVGDTEMYTSFRLSDGVSSQVEVATGDRIFFDNTELTSPNGACTMVSLYGTTAAHVNDGGLGETGDSVIPILVRIEGKGRVTGEYITWTGWKSGYRMTLVETIVTAHRSNSVSDGSMIPDTMPVFGLNLSASPSEDAVITRLEFGMAGDGAWRNCGNVPEMEESYGDFVEGTWTAYASSSLECSGLTSVKYFTLVPEDVIIPAGTTLGYELSLNTAGAVEGDSLQVILTEMCWYAYGDLTEVCTSSQGGLPVYGPTFAN